MDRLNIDMLREIINRCDLPSIFALYNVSRIFRELAKTLIYSRKNRRLINTLLQSRMVGKDLSNWTISQIRGLLLFTDGNWTFHKFWEVDYGRITKNAPVKVVSCVIWALPIHVLILNDVYIATIIQSIGNKKHSLFKYVILYQAANDSNTTRLTQICDVNIAKLLNSITDLCNFIDVMNSHPYGDLVKTKSAIRDICKSLCEFNKSQCDKCWHTRFNLCNCDFRGDYCDYPRNFDELRRLRDISPAIDHIYNMGGFRGAIADLENYIISARERFYTI